MKQLRTACMMLGVLSLLLGIIYPLAITGIAQLFFPFRANGSLIPVSSIRPQASSSPNSGHLAPGAGRSAPVGSVLIGQSFTSDRYFHGRPSDCGYDGAGSSSSNLGPSNPVLLAEARTRIDSIRSGEGIPGRTAVPPDLVLSSGSGLDPDITPAAALVQVARVARVRHLLPARVRSIVHRSTSPSFLGIFGRPHVNVLKLNLALDSISPMNEELNKGRPGQLGTAGEER